MRAQEVGKIGIVLNIFLCIIKFVAGIITNSIAILSDAFNSLSDILASAGIFFAVRISHKPADKNHPIGHQQAEPLAAFVVAVLTAVVGFQIISSSIQRFFLPREEVLGGLGIVVLLVAIAVKGWMFFFFKKQGSKHKSPALSASSVDARNDIIMSSIALVGFGSTLLGVLWVEGVVGCMLGAWLILVAYKLGAENTNFIMGGSADNELKKKIKEIVSKERLVHSINKIEAHYFGQFVNVVIIISVDRELTVAKSHTLTHTIREKIKKMPLVQECFVHVEPK